MFFMDDTTARLFAGLAETTGALRGGFDVFIAGLMSLPLMAGVFITALLTIIVSLVLFPLKVLLGVKGSAGWFAAGAVILLVAAVAATRLWNIVAGRFILARAAFVPLAAAREIPIGAVGFKARGVGVMRRLGLKTAPGFVVNGRVFARWAARNNADAELAAFNDQAGKCAKLERMFDKSPLPAAPFDRLCSEMTRLGARRLMVRSSFLDEDGRDSSMAGVYLSVEAEATPASVASAAAKVWASYFSQPAEEARRRAGGRARKLSLPLLIQEKIDHDVLIIACSANMLNGRLEEMPISFESRDGAEGTAIFNSLTGTLSPAGGAAPAFDVAVAQRLADVLLRLEAFHGRPVQIEAGIANDGFTFYQARSLTGFTPVATFTNSHVVDLIDVPLSPLSNSLFDLPRSVDRMLSSRFAPLGLPRGEKLLKEFSGRFYLDYNKARPFLNPHRRVPPQLAISAMKATAGVLFAPLTLRRDERLFRKLAALLSMRAISLEQLRRDVISPLFEMQFRLFTLSDALLVLMKSFLRRALDDDTDLKQAVEYVERQAFESPHADMLRAMARFSGSAPDSGAEFKRRHGHWGTPEAEVAAERLADLEALPATLPPPPRDLRRDAEDALAVDWALRRAWRRFALNAGGRAFRLMLSSRRRALSLRERVRDRLNFAMLAAKRTALNSGLGGEAFFMAVEELTSGRPPRGAFSKRRKAHENDLSVRLPALIHEPDTGADASAPDGVITGLGVGVGVVTAMALVAAAPCAPPEGEKPILIIERPDGAFGTMLGAVSGVVIERGSPLSHLVLLCREAGLPVIVGATGACAAFGAGDRVTLDAARGWMSIAGD